jgi:diacylglycerol kinase family enzyme
MQVDGELTGQMPVTFEIAPEPVEVIAPRETKRDGRRGDHRPR